MRSFAMMLTTLLTSMVLSTAACPSPEDSIIKRWYSVGIPAEGEPKTGGAWPVIQDSPRIQPVRYCYATEADYESLHELFIQAVERWKIATITSALRIQSEVGTESEPHKKCICSDPWVHFDALRIFDVTGKENLKGAATIGYRYDQNHAGRHFLKFHRGVDSRKDSLALAHEIGHAIGLDHEQSRPDASKWIEFRCKNLWDYEAVEKKIKAANDGHTIKDACNDRYIALKYDFSAWNYLPTVTGVLGAPQWSKDFDFDSVMLYSSYFGSPNKKPVTLRKRKWRTSKDDLKMGGWAETVSMGDAARVAYLYPDENFNADDQNESEPEWAPASGT